MSKKRKMMENKKLIVILLLIAIVFSILTVVVNMSVEKGQDLEENSLQRGISSATVVLEIIKNPNKTYTE
jgi:hypothetical protein